ncbi:MAG: O-methyltransferase [Bacteroidia bacterium]|nr:O-methyltransferase [Bacteroidia bacterium]NNF32032.1 O-methyltransferase [Flavobacteriaceae bacterium]MBT8276483.1 O-methyltransferase [Bacteroidia bacterium]NNJ81704.1 O-methyltransferase [Flavobacteriaceae bacterium]NNK53448.1 O-methyltransferase [Flavobacteriaceae bacterium]
MEFLPKKIDAYVVAHSQAEPKLLQELTRETWQKVLAPRMLSGHLQGRVLSMLSKLIKPKNILEIGTYTGYSALCLAEGLAEHGELHTIDINEELHAIQRKYFDKSGYGNQIFQHTGNALDIIPGLDYSFDLVFIDADKRNYPKYLDLLMARLPVGAVILSDNVLWSGKVVETVKEDDADTKALLQYNKQLNEHPKLESVLLPIRDGLTISRVL